MTAKLIRPRFDINISDDKENRLIIYTQVVSDQPTRIKYLSIINIKSTCTYTCTYIDIGTHNCMWPVLAN